MAAPAQRHLPQIQRVPSRPPQMSGYGPVCSSWTLHCPCLQDRISVHPWVPPQSRDCVNPHRVETGLLQLSVWCPVCGQYRGNSQPLSRLPASPSWSARMAHGPASCPQQEVPPVDLLHPGCHFLLRWPVLHWAALAVRIWSAPSLSKELALA